MSVILQICEGGLYQLWSSNRKHLYLETFSMVEIREWIAHMNKVLCAPSLN